MLQITRRVDYALIALTHLALHPNQRMSSRELAEVYSLSRALGVKTKELKDRLGDHKQLPTVQETSTEITTELRDLHKRFARDLAAKHKDERLPFRMQKSTLVKSQREARQKQSHFHQQRHITETQNRQARIRRGLGGAWDFITGARKRQLKSNGLETKQCAERDLKERDNMIYEHLEQRQTIQEKYQSLRDKHQSEKLALNANFMQSLNKGELMQSFNEVAPAVKQEQKPNHSPELGL